MAVPEWLFGPAGDLRPLPSTEMDVVNTVQRFGGVHNAINGARTVDVLGHRANYELEMTHLDPDEYSWLEALYTETVPGPFYLIDPLRKNLFSRESATARPADASGRGLRALNSSALRWQTVADSPVPWLKRGAHWSNLNVFPDNGAGIRLDSNTYIPLTPTGQITLSVFARSNEEIPVCWSARLYDADENELAGEDQPIVTLPADTWFRLSQTFNSAHADAVTIMPELWMIPGSDVSSSTNVTLLGFQAEHGSTPTEISLGGASMKVIIDTMDTTSPRYPLQSVTLSLLEV